VYGATVHIVDGDLVDCGARMRKDGDGSRWLDLSTLREPYRLEGKKTMGYEIAEQLGWTLPDVIVYPAGGGTGLIGIWKAIEELEQLGLVEPGRRPRMAAVQAAGCAPIVRAFEAGEGSATRWVEPHTYASGLKVPAAVGDYLMLQVLAESRGTALTVTDEEMATAQLEMARAEGIFAAPEGAATLAAARKLLVDGRLRPDETVVLLNTGSGLKYPKIPGLVVA
jgi:threonine synthase